ncbi:hypothetical protein SRO_2007 [Streptomyces rochei]|nr:hypothetical protein SRO_2007 [Streptomyces rochei]
MRFGEGGLRGVGRGFVPGAARSAHATLAAGGVAVARQPPGVAHGQVPSEKHPGLLAYLFQGQRVTGAAVHGGRGQARQPADAVTDRGRPGRSRQILLTGSEPPGPVPLRG